MRKTKAYCTLYMILAFFLMMGFAAFASDSDDQCDYMPAPAFTWEGELNPDEFDKWEVINVMPSGLGQVIVIIQNPDDNSNIQKVSIFLYFEILRGYRYFKDGQPYSYIFDSENAKYVEYKFTQEERRACMECHQDKLLVQDAI